MRAFFDAVRRDLREDPEFAEIRRELRDAWEMLRAVWREAVIFLVIVGLFAAAFTASVVVAISPP